MNHAAGEIGIAHELKPTRVGISRNHVVRELQHRLPPEGVKVPENTELQEVVKQVFSFDERRPQKPR